NARCVRLFDVYALEVHADLIGNDLSENRSRALANFSRTRKDSHTTVAANLDARLSFHLGLAAPGKPCPMKEQGYSYASPLSVRRRDGLARAGARARYRGFDVVVLGPLDDSVQHVTRADAPFELLTCCRDVALAEHIDPPDFHRIQAERGGDLFHLHLVRKGDLRRPKPPKSPVRRSVGGDCSCGYTNVVASIRTRRMDGPSGEHDRSQRNISAAVEDNIDLACN